MKLFDKPLKSNRRVHRAILRLMKQEELPEAVRFEVCELFADWRIHGSAGFNQRRVDKTMGCSTRKALVGFMRKMERRGLVRALKGYAAGGQCTQWEFCLNSKNPGFSLANRSAYIYLPSSHTSAAQVQNRDLRTVKFSPELVRDREEKWMEWSEREGHRNRRDRKGETAWGRATRRGLQAIRIPLDKIDLEETAGLRDTQVAWMHRYLENKGEYVHGVVSLKRYRLYHSLSQCPRRIRRHAEIFHNGTWEPLVSVDVHAMYYCALASMLEDGECKRQLIADLKSRDFYEKLAREAGMENGPEFKRQVMMQVLFWKSDEWPDEDRPIWQAVLSLYGDLAHLIKWLRWENGRTGLSDLLMDKEAEIVVHGALLDMSEKCPCISNHDALLVPQSMADEAMDVIAAHACNHLGFVPNIKVGQ